MNELDGMADRTLLDPLRLTNLARLSVSIESGGVPGCIVEVGVFRGGSLELLALENLDRDIHGFDTFEGIPYQPGELDLHRKGDFAASFEEVSAFLAHLKRVKLHKGIFPYTMPRDLGPIAIAHIDVDMERSARDCILYLWPLVSPGGFMVFDDYAAEACPGVKRVVDEYFMGSVIVQAPPQGWVQKVMEVRE